MYISLPLGPFNLQKYSLWLQESLPLATSIPTNVLKAPKSTSFVVFCWDSTFIKCCYNCCFSVLLLATGSTMLPETLEMSKEFLSLFCKFSQLTSFCFISLYCPLCLSTSPDLLQHCILGFTVSYLGRFLQAPPWVSLSPCSSTPTDHTHEKPVWSSHNNGSGRATPTEGLH